MEGLNLKLKRTEVQQQPQLSADLVRIMEQRLSAIKHRTACFHNLINRFHLSDIDELIIPSSELVFFKWLQEAADAAKSAMF
uniref:Uncharacterized protein n=1 Tax=Fagus sylvatica TaxID=28930 RepID=A0A2N9FP92_FAGSY